MALSDLARLWKGSTVSSKHFLKDLNVTLLRGKSLCSWFSAHSSEAGSVLLLTHCM